MIMATTWAPLRFKWGVRTYLIHVTSLRDFLISQMRTGNSFLQVNVPWTLLRQFTLLWRHNGDDSISNHQPHRCLLNRLFRRRSKKTSKLRVTGLCPHKWPVTRNFFPFDDVIMIVWFHKSVQGIVSFQANDEYLGLYSDSLWLFF